MRSNIITSKEKRKTIFIPHLGLCEYVIVHTTLPPSPVILWINLGGRPKWLPLKFWYLDLMRTSSLQVRPRCVYIRLRVHEWSVWTFFFFSFQWEKNWKRGLQGWIQDTDWKNWARSKMGLLKMVSQAKRASFKCCAHCTCNHIPAWLIYYPQYLLSTGIT